MKTRIAGLFSLLLAVLLVVPAHATEQIADEIRIGGTSYPLYSEPFGQVLDQPDMWQRFIADAKSYLGACTANWRGYRAWWSIEDGRLLLQRMVYGACADDAPEAELRTYFPTQAAPVHAQWFSGTLVVPVGTSSGNHHMGYSGRYPSYRMIDVAQGVVIRELTATHEQLSQWQRANRERAEAARGQTAAP